MSEKDLLKLVKKAIQDKKGEAIKIVDVKKITPFANFYVICSANNFRQLDAIKDSVVTTLEENKHPIKHVEGKGESGWVLVDAGSIIINIFSKSERERFKLDEFLSQKR